MCYIYFQPGAHKFVWLKWILSVTLMHIRTLSIVNLIRNKSAEIFIICLVHQAIHLMMRESQETKPKKANKLLLLPIMYSEKISPKILWHQILMMMAWNHHHHGKLAKCSSSVNYMATKPAIKVIYSNHTGCDCVANNFVIRFRQDVITHHCCT